MEIKFIFHTFHHWHESTNWRKNMRKYFFFTVRFPKVFLAHGTKIFSLWKKLERIFLNFPSSPFAFQANFPIHSFSSAFLILCLCAMKNLICFRYEEIINWQMFEMRVTQWKKVEIISAKIWWDMKVKKKFQLFTETQHNFVFMFRESQTHTKTKKKTKGKLEREREREKCESERREEHEES